MPPCCPRAASRHCCRQYVLQRALALLCVAALLSLSVPNAPLNRLLQTEETERQRLLAENQARLEQSQRFLHAYRTTNTTGRGKSLSSAVLDDSDPTLKATTGEEVSGTDVGVTVLTMKRGGKMKNGDVIPSTHYLTQSVARLLQLLNSTSLARSYRLAVCNVDEQPEALEEAVSLEDMLPVWRRFKSPHTESGTAEVGTWEKYKMDYVYCLRRTLAQRVQYALLVEDDAVAHVQLFEVLEHVMGRVLERPGARPVAYVKLYHPQRVLGYISLEVERLTELVAVALTLGAALTWTSHVLGAWRGLHGMAIWLNQARRLSTGQQAVTETATLPSADTSPPSLSRRQWLWRWLWWAVVVAVLALAVGRANLLELRRVFAQLYQVTPTPSCCTPAVLYTQRGAGLLTDFFSNVTCTAQRSIDMRMDDFRQRTGERGLLVQPSLFQHIGLVSTLRDREVNPLIIP